MSLNILLLEDVHASATSILQTLRGAEIVRLKHAPDARELKTRLADVQVLGLRSRTVLDIDILEHAPQLRAVGAYCTGTNNIDLRAAAERGVALFNGPFSNTRSVAELVIGHAIHLLRRVPERHAAAKRGEWLKDARGSNEIRGKTLGIVGYGKIGTQTGLLAESIGMRVIYHDIEACLPGFEHKRFPSCYMTHRLIAGILAMRERHPGRVHSRQVRIDIEVPKNGLAALKHPRPGTGLEAKFSGPYCAAVAWLDGRVELSSFDDAAVLRPNVREQMAGVTRRERAEAGERLESAPVHVTVSTENWSDTIEVNWAPGSNADPLTREQLLEKWTDCAGHGRINGKDAVVRLLDAPLDSAEPDLLGPLRELLLTAVRRAARKTTPSLAPAVLTG